MFFKFNNMAGRIAPSTQAAAFSPQGVYPLAAEATAGTQFYFDSKATKKATIVEAAVPAAEIPQEIHRAPIGSTPKGVPHGKIFISVGYKKLMSMQQHMTKHDGLMVWQKMGMRDKLPFWLTMASVAVGLVATSSVFWSMSWPKKQ